MAEYRWPKTLPMRDGTGGKDTLWFRLTVYEMSSQNLNARNNGGIIAKSTGETFYFLSPMQFQENISHDWAPYDSIASSIADKAKTFGRVAGEVQGIVDTVSDSNLDSISISSQSNLKDSLKNASVSQVKMDTPLAYEGSTRREITLMFLLSALPYNGADIYEDVVKPVQLLKEYSSADFEEGDILNIKFPYIFSIDTVDGNGKAIKLLNYSYAALRSVQPTYEGPFINGSPMKCELTLTFMDIEPLYRKSFQYASGAGRVTTSTA